MADRIRVLSVIDGLGYAGDETRMLNMSLGLDRTRFSHSFLTLNPLAYGDANEYRARKNHYLEAGIQVDDLADCAPEHSLQITGDCRPDLSEDRRLPARSPSGSPRSRVEGRRH